MATCLMFILAIGAGIGYLWTHTLAGAIWGGLIAVIIEVILIAMSDD